MENQNKGADGAMSIVRKTFPVGPLQCNCTIMGDTVSGIGYVFDPAAALADPEGFSSNPIGTGPFTDIFIDPGLVVPAQPSQGLRQGELTVRPLGRVVEPVGRYTLGLCNPQGRIPDLPGRLEYAVNILSRFSGIEHQAHDSPSTDADFTND